MTQALNILVVRALVNLGLLKLVGVSLEVSN